MTANPVPGLSLPYPQTPSQQQNLQELQRWAKTVSPRMLFIENTDGDGFGYEAPGPPKAPTDAYLMGVGIVDIEVTWTSVGDDFFSYGSVTGALTFPTPFPNGLAFITFSPSPFQSVWSVVANDYPFSRLGVNNVAVLASYQPPGPGRFSTAYQAIGW